MRYSLANVEKNENEFGYTWDDNYSEYSSVLNYIVNSSLEAGLYLSICKLIYQIFIFLEIILRAT